mmetsp:Transcript_37173/g.74300  ORF Transcript_37173/g.74300 Transcript_37173/m.74300 type:complete len:350 (-) Transcript_37173:454-1503(-)
MRSYWTLAGWSAPILASIAKETAQSDMCLMAVVTSGKLKIEATTTVNVKAEEFETDAEALANLATLADSVNVSESIAGVQYRLYGPGASGAQSMKMSGKTSTGGGNTQMTPEDKERLIFFEQLFFTIDEDNGGKVSDAECNLLLSFCAFDLTFDDREKVFLEADKVADNVLTRMEFCELCRNYLWEVPLPTLEKSAENLRLARQALRDRHKCYWKNMADQLDGYARPVLPSAYIMILVIMLNLDFRDDYDTNPARLMAQGHLQTFAKPTMTVCAVVLALVVLVSVVGVFWMKRITRMVNDKAKMQEINAVRDLSKKTMAASTRLSSNSPLPRSKTADSNRFDDQVVSLE